MGAFAEMAAEYARLGLAPTPAWGPDGKRPLLKGYNQRVLQDEAIADVAKKFPYANVALLTGASGLDVIDVDDPSILNEMISRFGETPLIIKTAGRCGYQLYYRHSPHVRAANLRASEGLPVEVRAGSNIVIAPPSRSPITGRSYTCVNGAFDQPTLAALPQICVPNIFKSRSAAEHRRITQGHRNDWLFQQCLRAAHHVDDLPTLLDVARTRNEELESPLADTEVCRVASSAWRYQSEDRNFVGAGGHVVLPRRRIDAICAADPGNPIGLLLRLELEHGARISRGESFALSRRAMSQSNTLPGWSEKQIRRAKEAAEGLGFIMPVRKEKGSAVQYTIPDSGGGPSLGPNVTKTPLPSLPYRPRTSREACTYPPNYSSSTIVKPSN